MASLRLRSLTLSLASAGALALAFTTAATASPAAAAAPKLDPKAVERGAYLATIGGCNDCHTPFKLGPHGPEPDMSRMLSGHPEGLVMPPAPKLDAGPWVWIGAGTNTAFAGPWGISYAPNLTPDENTGFGIWTEEMFLQAMRTGRHFGVARPILPPMPWPNLARATDEDLKAIYAFLRSLPPIKNRVPEAVVAEAPPAAVPAGR